MTGTASLGAGRVLLLVEDEDPLRKILGHALELSGFRVIAAANGLEALEKVDAQSPIDLVLTDVRMPHLDGPGLCQRLWERWPGLPVVYMTGYPETDLPSHAQRPTRLLRKPVSLFDLLRTIQAILEPAAR